MFCRFTLWVLLCAMHEPTPRARAHTAWINGAATLRQFCWHVNRLCDSERHLFSCRFFFFKWRAETRHLTLERGFALRASRVLELRPSSAGRTLTYAYDIFCFDARRGGHTAERRAARAAEHSSCASQTGRDETRGISTLFLAASRVHLYRRDILLLATYVCE